jgi:hypothetical protein
MTYVSFNYNCTCVFFLEPFLAKCHIWSIVKNHFNQNAIDFKIYSHLFMIYYDFLYINKSKKIQH